MNINVTKLSVDQFDKYFEFVKSVTSCNYTEKPDGWSEVWSKACDEKRRRDNETQELFNRLEPLLLENWMAHRNAVRRRQG